MNLKVDRKYRIEKEGIISKVIVDFMDYPYFPTLEDSPEVFKEVMKILLKERAVSSIVIESDKNIIYDERQTAMLNEVRNLLYYLLNDFKIIPYTFSQLRKVNARVDEIADKLGDLKKIIFDLMMSDPIGAYIYTLRKIKILKVMIKKYNKQTDKVYLLILEKLKEMMENLQMIKLVKNRVLELRIGDRKIYREIFKPVIMPGFFYTKVLLHLEEGLRFVEEYYIEVDDQKIPVRIYEHPVETRYYYYVVPPEFKLEREEMEMLVTVREILAKMRYLEKAKDVRGMMEFRRIMYNVAFDLVSEVAKEREINVSLETLEKLAKIITRLTAGFGVLEVLLSDDLVEDIYVNPPPYDSRIIVKHANYGECLTNIILSMNEVEGWITRFRLYSGRPLDEAHPVLDTELETEVASARLAIVQEPFSPHGYGITARRHRKRPWTLPLLVKYKSINPLVASLLWFLVESGRAFLIAGTRGSGKTSLMTATMLAIPRKHRIITIEDTLEIPFFYFKKLGFNIVSLKVRSAIAGEEGELTAADGIRTSLRLGDSALVIGEVRSTEALSLYEAMRVGAMANAVLGTIHADSPQGVFDRVVNDLNVPRTSFKATDIIIIVNKLRSPDLMKEYRRVIQVTEVRKHWEEDPLLEGGFVDLIKYDPYVDDQRPTPTLLEGESEVIKAIMARVREWFGRFDRVWNNLMLRAELIQYLVNFSKKVNNQEIIEADFVVDFYDKFRKTSTKFDLEKEREEFLKEMKDWIENEARRRGLV